METDPYLWTCAEVQDFFRNRALDWAQDRPHSHFPDATSFLQALKDNEVNGPTLLEDIDSTSLRDDFDIKKVGVRGTVLHCIKKLRKASSTYNSHKNSSQQSASPRPPVQSLPKSPAQPFVEPLVELPTETIPTADASGIVEITDAQGRKRRRLQLPNLVTDPTANQVSSIHANFKEHGIDDVDLGYLKDSALTVDKVFFGRAKIGQELEGFELPKAVQSTWVDCATAEDEDNFQFYHHQTTPGRALFVNARMQHYFSSSDTILLRRGDRDAIAHVPYPERLQRKARSAVVVRFTSNHDEPGAFRELAAYLNGGETFSEIDESIADQLEFAQGKFGGAEDEVLPLWQKSELDDAFSVSSSDSESDEAESAVTKSRQLGPERVAEIIDGATQTFVTEWQAKLPEREAKDAWTLWKKTKQRESIRSTLIGGAQAYIARLSARLVKMKEELHRTEWYSEKSLQKACENLEPTVEELQEEQWKISVWLRRHEPTHTVVHRDRQTKSSKRAHDDHDFVVDDNENIPGQQFGQTASKSIEGLADASETAQKEPDLGLDMRNGEEMNLYDADGEEHDNVDGGTPAALQTDDDPAYSAADVAPGIVDHEIDSPPSTPGLDTSAANKSQSLASESDVESLPSVSQLLPSTQKGEEDFSRSQMTTVVDLTSDASKQSPPATIKTRPSFKKGRAPPADPLSATESEVNDWDLYGLARNNDKLRLLIKLLAISGHELRQRMYEKLHSPNQQTFVSALLQATQALQVASSATGLNTNDTTFHCSKIYLAWIVSSTEILDWATKPAVGHTLPVLDESIWRAVLNHAQVDLFVPMLRRCLELRHSKLFAEPVANANVARPATILTISSDDDLSPQAKRVLEHSSRTPHKKRKREVKVNDLAGKVRKTAHERQDRYAQAQTTDSSELAAMLESGSNPQKVAINPARSDKEDPIYIIAQIAKRLKAHQIDGIRFLWREITNCDPNEDSHGCILAHTMGLGKTMQVLALLAALDTTAQSQNTRIFEQLPAQLRSNDVRDNRRLRTLILCPPALISNWRREIKEWIPDHMWHIFSLEAGKAASYWQQLGEWMDKGGILFVGYEMFRKLVKPKDGLDGSTVPNRLYGNELLTIADIILKKTEIVVADEAHYLKGERAEVRMAACRLRTPFRIGLSGTPMSNDTGEIYALVSWVAPGYLGSAVEFRAFYTEPIQEGLYFDSSNYEKRRSIKKLKVLHHEIEPKVHRATIEAVRGSLPPKIEFVITVPLTKVQTELYKRTIGVILRRSENTSAVYARIFGWLALLTLLTNHPICFQKKLLTPPKRASSAHLNGLAPHLLPATYSINGTNSGPSTPKEAALTTADQNADGEGSLHAPGDDDVGVLGFSSTMIREILEEMHNDIDMRAELSAKVTIFTRLLQYCLSCKDKVLVFSTSIPTLEYLDKLLKAIPLEFGRIDGSVSPAERMSLIEKFHNDYFSVMLISTRAGSTGLNMFGANRVFIFDFSFNPTWEEQAVGRAYRIGQKKPVYVYRFVAGGTFEANIYNTQQFKSSLSQRVVDKKNPRRTAERKTSEWLYEPRYVPQRNLSEWVGKDENVLDRLLHESGVLEKGTTSNFLIRDIMTMETLQIEALDAPLNDQEQQEVDEEIAQGKGRRRRMVAI